VSVLYVIDRETQWLDEAPPWSCQKCARPVTPPAVYWQGLQKLLFHPECAAKLGPHLIADAREAALAADAAPHWRCRNRPIWPHADMPPTVHRLEREEVAV
jgi:hypothetical protein